MNETLIDDIKIIIKENKDEINKTGKGFNLISLMGMENNERYTHSNIIAELLNANGSHTFGNKFLKVFLEQVGISNFDIKNYEVKTEEYVGKILLSNGERRRTFLDIVVKDKTSGKVILIENKIWAEDQIEQLERYFKSYEGKIIKLFYLNVNIWNEFPTERPDILNVLQNISYQNEIRNWLANCIVASIDKPFVNKQIETYFQTILNITNQDIYSKMSTDINTKMIENLESFKTAIEIGERINVLKYEKIAEFDMKLRKAFEDGSIYFDNKILTYRILRDSVDFLFLGFNLYDNNSEAKTHLNDENLKKLLELTFNGKNNDYYIGWLLTIDVNSIADLYNLCKDVDAVVVETKTTFEAAIAEIKKILEK